MSPAGAGTYATIYAVVRRIPRGRVATYGQIAELAGLPGHARQVDSGGEISQRLRLEQEGVRFDAGGRVALERVRWRPLTEARHR